MLNNRLTTQSCNQKKVFLRADLNVPLTETGIVDDQRLQALLPTLQLLVQNAASTVIATHLGQPDPSNHDQALSTKRLLPWFAAHGFTPHFAATPTEALGQLKQGTKLILLENLRFFAGEQSPNLAADFAKTLATLADCYVTDAFGTLHRNDTSIALLPLAFAPESRLYGLCIAQEAMALDKLRQAPKKPFLAILGGNKLATKLPLIEQLVTAPEAERITHLLLGGCLAMGLEQTAPNLAALAAKNRVAMIVPIDYLTDAAGNQIDIGPKTIDLFTPFLASAQTIFANGTMGKYEEKDGQAGTYAMLKAIAGNPGYTLIGGGDCGAAAAQCGVGERMSFVSTGGGATLAYLASKKPWEDLPGLFVLTYSEVK